MAWLSTRSVLPPAEIAEAFLADGGDEEDVASRLDSGAEHRPDYGEHQSESAGVVADSRRQQTAPVPPHRHVRALREHGVEMGDHRHRLAPRRSLKARGHVAHALHLDPTS